MPCQRCLRRLARLGEIDMDDGRGRLEELIQGGNDLRAKYMRARDKL
jgi:hypothetical protein